MKIRVTVDDRSVDVEVGDLDARPIIAVVEGERFEVWPEPERAPAEPPSAQAADAPARTAPEPVRQAAIPAPAPSPPSGRAVTAPLPGVIESVDVHPGEAVVAGQPLCVIEAMKMKNVIRAPRPGEIARVHVAPGQHVRHNEALLEYA
jgi:biotin carboxyl carrier protein